MRRVQPDVFLRPDSNSTGENAGVGTGHAVPASHDIWLYLFDAARDPTVFEADVDIFRFDRYIAFQPQQGQTPDVTAADAHSVPSSLIYSAGLKTCLDIDLIREIVIYIGEVMVQEDGFILGLVMDGEGVEVWVPSGWRRG